MKLIDTGRSSNGFSTIGSMLYCPRKHAFDLESRAAGADGQRHASATDRGTLVHVALAHHYITKVAGENPADWYPWRDALLQTREGKQFEEEEPQFMVYLRNLMGSYFTFYEDVDRDDWEILHVEREYRARIGGHPIGRRIDLVARHRGTGKIWFWDHKCLPRSARVLTAGGVKTVGELVSVGARPTLAAWVDGKLVWQQCPTPRSNGLQRVYSIALATGTQGRYGETHPLLTDRGWVPASDVREGMRVAVPLDWPEQAEIDVPDHVLSTGASLICDGSLGQEHRIAYTKDRESKRNRFRAALRQTETSFKEYESATKAASIHFSWSSPMGQELLRAGLPRCKSADKYIPAQWMLGSKRQLGIVLGALWSGDGAAYVVKDRGQERLRIVYASRSLALCINVQELLLRLGIYATVSSSSVAYKGERRGYHFTTVAGRYSKHHFLNMVENDQIVAPEIKEISRDLRLIIPNGKAGRGQETLIKDGAAWVKVRSSVCINTEETFDFEVPEYHTFVANEVVTHNTSSGTLNDLEMRYLLSGDMLLSRLLGKAQYGEEFGGILINKIRVYQKIVNPQFDRVELPPVAEATLQSFRDSLIRAYEQRELLKLRPDGTPRPAVEWPGAHNELVCLTRYGLCPYFFRCQDGD